MVGKQTVCILLECFLCANEVLGKVMFLYPSQGEGVYGGISGLAARSHVISRGCMMSLLAWSHALLWCMMPLSVWSHVSFEVVCQEGRGLCQEVGLCEEGSLWGGSLSGEGSLSGGGWGGLQREPLVQTSSGRHQSGHYLSCWNAFFFFVSVHCYIATLLNISDLNTQNVKIQQFPHIHWFLI